MTVVAWLGLLLGIVIVVVTFSSVFETTVVPRGNRSRFTKVVLRLMELPIRRLADNVADYARRDTLLAYTSAVYVISTLFVWLALFLVGYALILWPFAPNLGEAFRVAGSSLVTLGIAAFNAPVPTVVILLAALTGLVVVALQIAYLPILYQAYNRRETLVTMLEGLAGTPGWGPIILTRSASIDNLDGLAAMYERWMEWSADVSESHSAYVILMYFRSPTSQRSWVVSLLSILDAGAMHLALCPVTAPPQARNMMRIGYLAFRQLASDLDVVPAFWSGTRRRPGPALHPIEPVDRVSVSAEVTELRRIGGLRRERRRALMEAKAHHHHEGDDDTDAEELALEASPDEDDG